MTRTQNYSTCLEELLDLGGLLRANSAQDEDEVTNPKFPAFVRSVEGVVT